MSKRTPTTDEWLATLEPAARERFYLRRELQRHAAYAAADLNKTRLYFHNRVVEYDEQRLAYSVWLALPKGTRCAFRSAGDSTSVYSHDLVDRL